MEADNEPNVLTAKVLTFTAEQLGVRMKKLSMSTRLTQDLGMDGDDAVEFFDKFGDRFCVDLEELHRNWVRHFSPEGALVQPSLALMIVCGGGVVLGFILKDVVGLLPTWAWALALIVIALLIHRKWFAEEVVRPPVTVADLVESARSGRWNKSYPDDSWRHW